MKMILKGLGKGFTYLWYGGFRYRRNLIADNLTLAYGDKLSESDKDELVFRNLLHYVYLGLEFCQLLWLSKKRLLSSVEFKNKHFLDEALQGGKGVVVLSSHLGNFEWAAAVGAQVMGRPIHIVARSIRNGFIHRWLSQVRKHWGIVEILPQNAKWGLFKILKRGGLVGFMIDQRKSPPDGVWVPFFGKLACTTQGVTYLVERTDALVLPTYCYRTDFSKFVVQFEKPLEYKRVGTRRQNSYHNTEVYSRTVESFIRRHPEQWFWIHRRWKGYQNAHVQHLS